MTRLPIADDAINHDLQPEGGDRSDNPLGKQALWLAYLRRAARTDEYADCGHTNRDGQKTYEHRSTIFLISLSDSRMDRNRDSIPLREPDREHGSAKHSAGVLEHFVVLHGT